MPLMCPIMFVFCPHLPAGSVLLAQDVFWSADMGKFPALEAENLAAQKLVLPSDFAGERNLLLLGFRQEQQHDIDTWLRVLPQFTNFDTHFRYYELPIVGRMNFVGRWLLDAAMRQGIRDQQARERTITLYVDKPPLLKALRLPDDKSIYVLLIDRAGRVLWRVEGVYSDRKGTSLRCFLQNTQYGVKTREASSETK